MFIFHEVLHGRVYQVSPQWLDGEPRVIVDLGANVGLAALARHNLAGLGARARIFEAAVSDSAGRMRLALAPEHYNASLVRGGTGGIEVDTMTMEQIIAQAGIETIDVLKMDIEGGEKLILPARPAWLKRVGVLLAELHDGYGFSELERDVSAAGLRVLRVGSAQAVATRIASPAG